MRGRNEKKRNNKEVVGECNTEVTCNTIYADFAYRDGKFISYKHTDNYTYQHIRPQTTQAQMNTQSCPNTHAGRGTKNQDSLLPPFFPCPALKWKVLKLMPLSPLSATMYTSPPLPPLPPVGLFLPGVNTE